VLTDQDIYLFREGTHGRLFDQFGSRLSADGSAAHFAVWAPNAAEVSVIGDWNGWNAAAHRLAPRPDGSGIWEGTAPGVQRGQAYKYRITSRVGGYSVEKADPLQLVLRSASGHGIARMDAGLHLERCRNG